MISEVVVLVFPRAPPSVLTECLSAAALDIHGGWYMPIADFSGCILKLMRSRARGLSGLSCCCDVLRTLDTSRLGRVSIQEVGLGALGMVVHSIMKMHRVHIHLSRKIAPYLRN